MDLRDAVICEPVRTPVGRYGGMLRELPAHELASIVLRGILERTGISPGDVDDVIFGQVYQTSEAPALGRLAALNAGFPIEVPGLQLDRRCGSGLQAIVNAAMQVQTGASDVVIAGGAESMSGAVFYSSDMRWGSGRNGVIMHDALFRGRITAGGEHHPVPGGMLETAENLRREYSVSREEQDWLSLLSHQRAVKAQADGHFEQEIVPVTVRKRSGLRTVTVDEHPRPGLTLEALAALRPVRRHEDPEATVTAGNASGQNDAAAACIVTHPEEAERLGLRPLARLASWAVAGVAPERMGIGAVPATQQALDKLGVGIEDMELVELNEAFAAQVLACTREWGFDDADFDRLNVVGSGISLGHPVGATGVRIAATLTREMWRREARYGLETMCIGGGQGMAAVWERWTR